MFINKNDGTYTNSILYFNTEDVRVLVTYFIFGDWHASCSGTHVKSLYNIWIE